MEKRRRKKHKKKKKRSKQKEVRNIKFFLFLLVNFLVLENISEAKIFTDLLKAGMGRNKEATEKNAEAVEKNAAEIEKYSKDFLLYSGHSLTPVRENCFQCEFKIQSLRKIFCIIVVCV